ncbi:MAG: hypothetical protein R3192_13940 [Woeseiaceae bacterium]|nr:hypothetical protein [Woeseiaceae bacterium]
MKNPRPVAGIFLSVVFAVILQYWPGQAAHAQDTRSLGALEWRNIGPHRGGRVTAVAGVPSQPRTFYFGAPGGGVWKTQDAGVSWSNVSDKWFKTGSVGAIAVALSDANVVYAGMGEHCVRDVTVSHGDGVYRSTDGGATWRNVGLGETRHISKVLVHPGDPDIVYVGAQGTPWGPSDARGVYRTMNGGRTWERVLDGDEYTGANDLAMDPHNPRILYAAMWEHRRKPWHGYQMTSGGPGSALYKSTDGGDTWQKLSEGFPEPTGKFAIAVSAADSKRLYALVEAVPGKNGVYVSDDAGAHWRQVNSDHVVTERSAYYMHIVADPQDRETVYVLNAPFLKSIDGGKTFERITVPHGDNHDLWIHPQHSNWMIQANDGGVNVSYNGGASWSTQGNQPTAQFYRVNVDNLFPYNVYAGQQDNSTVKIASRTFGAGIGPKDWYAIGGGESAHVAFDPDNPRYVYAGNYQGQITVFDDQTRIARDIRRYPLAAAYRPPGEYPYRFNWNAPIVVSQHDPSIVYHGAQMLLKSTDRGQTWTEISGDLTRNDKQKQGVVDGEFTFEGTAGAMYNTIFYVAESPHDSDEIWVGSDDGLLHLTRDGGQNWQSITPRGLDEGQVNMIELSRHTRGKAYAVLSRYKFDDFTPYIYKTDDYGRRWTRIDGELPNNDWVRVVREDPHRAGLLFAGTQTSFYVSFDDGRNWQSLQLNLPHVPVTDLRVHDGDLVVSTEGRAFWILDDISVLRQLDGDTSGAAFYLYKPQSTERVAVRSFGRPGGLGENPPTGSFIHYSFADAPEADTVSLDILSADGEVLKKITPGSEEDSMPVKAGLNRFVWDWRVGKFPDSQGLDTWRGPLGYRVQPGRYTVRLNVGDDSTQQAFEVLGDPRVEVSPADARQKQQLLEAILADADTLAASVDALQTVRTRANQLLRTLPPQDRAQVEALHDALVTRIDDWLNDTIEEDDEHFVNVQHSSTRMDFSLLEVMFMVDVMDPPLTQGMLARVNDVRNRWSALQNNYAQILERELSAMNAVITGMSIPAISISKGNDQ